MTTKRNPLEISADLEGIMFQAREIDHYRSHRSLFQEHADQATLKDHIENAEFIAAVKALSAELAEALKDDNES